MTRAALTLVVCAVLLSCAPRGKRETLDVAGTAREFVLFSPPDASANAPVVFALHGAGGTAVGMQRFTGLNEVARDEGFHVVYPQGVDNVWNDGRDVEGRGADDVAFITALVAEIDQRLSPEKRFITGVSNGAFMTWRLICEGTTLFSAAAPVIGGRAVSMTESCAPAGPLPMMIVQGTDDPLVPYEGGNVAGDDRGQVEPTEETLAFMQTNNACDPEATSVENLDDVDDGTSITRTRWTSCTAPLEELRMNDGGHTWPGGNQYLPEATIGKVSEELEGELAIWAFFDASR